MKKRHIIYEGKAKIIYKGPDDHTFIQYFKDDTTAHNNQKHAIIEGKGVLNNFISAFIMDILHQAGIKTHFIKRLNSREQLIQQLDVIPIEVVVRRKAMGSFCKRYGTEEGFEFESPLIEFFYKDDQKGDPLIAPETILSLELCDHETLDEIVHMALTINHILYGLFSAYRLDLVDFKLEFGLKQDEEYEDLFDVILVDEISPDNCRLKCMRTGESFDKDIFRNGDDNLMAAYSHVADLMGLSDMIAQEEKEKIVHLNKKKKK